MFRIQFYTDMHAVDYLPPVEERMLLISFIENWRQKWTENETFVMHDMCIPAREIRYMQIVEV